MIEMELIVQGVVPTALHWALKDNLATYHSLSTAPGDRVVVRLDDTATDQDKALVDNILKNYDSNRQPPLDPLAKAISDARGEIGADAQVQALISATPGQIGAWYDSLSLAQKNAIGRAAVIMLFAHEARLKLIERNLGL